MVKEVVEAVEVVAVVEVAKIYKVGEVVAEALEVGDFEEIYREEKN